MTSIPFRRALLVLSVAVALITVAVPSGATGSANWSGYLFDTGHSSFNAATSSITSANTSSLTKYWQWKPAPATQSGQPGPALWASATVVSGRVYIGADTGVFYALDLATKRVVWSRFLGFVTKTTCGQRGFTSTATVAPDTSRGGQLTVYVAAADGYLYALRAIDGGTVWRAVVGIPSATQNDYYNWGSPTVRNGKIYMGISSQCDMPLVRGGVRGYLQSSGASIGTYFAVPSGQVGGSVWSSVAVAAAGDAFASTGNATAGDGQSIVHLNGSTMARLDGWEVPAAQQGNDSDFGASPTLFSATVNGSTTPMVGACNKNGWYYALRQQNLSAGPVWSFQVADAGSASSCLTAAIWDGRRLFVAGPLATIGGTQFPGSLRRLNPATGAVIWARGLNGTILGSPTMNGAGVIAVATFDMGSTNSIYLINSANGQLLRTISLGTTVAFGQPVFADNYLLVPTTGQGLLIYRV